jgi:hypothetical protein
MKKFTLISSILFCCSINTYAAEFEFVAGDNTHETKICIAAVNDNTQVMVSKLKMMSIKTALRYRSMLNIIQCNGQFIGNFAKKYHAENTSAYLAKYTNKWNKKHQPNITIKDLTNAQGMNEEENIIVLARSN